MEEAWDHATESNEVSPSGELSLSPQRYFPGSTQASITSVSAQVDHLPGGEHAPKLVDFVAQDRLEARLHHREHTLQASLLPVNHAGESRVSVPAPRTNSQDIAVGGPFA